MRYDNKPQVVLPGDGSRRVEEKKRNLSRFHLFAWRKSNNPAKAFFYGALSIEEYQASPASPSNLVKSGNKNTHNLVTKIQPGSRGTANDPIFLNSGDEGEETQETPLQEFLPPTKSKHNISL